MVIVVPIVVLVVILAFVVMILFVRVSSAINRRDARLREQTRNGGRYPASTGRQHP